MKPKEIKTKLKELGYDENKYFDIRDFLHTNGNAVKDITNIETCSWCSVYVVLFDEFILEV